MPLSDQQLRFFDTFGYLAFPGLLADRIQSVIDEFDGIWKAHGGGHHGKVHDGTARSCIVQFIDRSDALSSLLDDPRIYSIAQSLLGDEFNYMGSDGNYYAGETGWHSDGWHATVKHIKIAFYLDQLDGTNGALRVVPGSHRVGDGYAESLQKSLFDCGGSFAMHGRDIPAVALATKPGDIVCFNHNTKHSSFNGGQRRRMFTINLCQRYPEERPEELRDYIKGFARFWIERVYGPQMMATAGPARMRQLEQVMANDGHLAELSRAAQASMPEPSRG